MTPYPEYKATNLPWLPQIPTHWKIVRNKNVLKEQKEVVGEHSSEYTLLSLTLSGVIPRDMENCKGKFPAEFDKYKIVQKGDIIFCLFDIDETPRAVGLSEHAGMITGAYDVFSISNVDSRFLYYYYLNVDNQKSLKPYYTGLRKVVNISRFLGLQFPLPSTFEQEQIVRYLDSMTAKINKLIRAKKKQIALLQEQKQAIINQAVTKGLNPDAEMKDSGIDWLGQIPAHWAIKSFSKIASIKSNLVKPEDYYDYPQIAPDKIEKNTGKLFSVQSVRESGVISNNHLFFKGQILYSKIRPLLNKVTIAPFDGLCSADMYPIETILQTEYLKYFMLSSWFLYQIKQSGDRVKMPKINQEEMAKLQIVIPTDNEQKNIVCFINNRWNQINIALESLEKSIIALHEYKNCLIASVVTGQVDVRNILVEEFDPADLAPETDDDPAEDDDQLQEESEVE